MDEVTTALVEVETGYLLEDYKSEASRVVSQVALYAVLFGSLIILFGLRTIKRSKRLKEREK